MQRTQVGQIEIAALIDGGFTFPVERVYSEAGTAMEPFRHYLDSDGQLTMACTCFLLRGGGRTVLIDTGLGPESEGQLLTELQSVGVSPDEVDTVCFTHLHGDHTGWNIDRGSGRPVFARARYLVPQGDWDHYRAQAEARSFTRDVAPLESLGCLELVAGDHAVTPAITAVSTPGHTPGHLSFAVVSGAERGFILGDVVLSAIDTEEPTFTNTFDTDHPLAERTRLAMLDRLEASGELVGAAHLPAPGLGHFVRADGRRTWRALT